MNLSLIDLYRQAEDYFLRGISLKCLNLGNGAIAYMTGGAGLNFIYITNNANKLDQILSRGEQFYASDNLPFDVIISQEVCTRQIGDILNTRGYLHTSQSGAMVIQLGKFMPDITTDPKFETTIKSNDDQLNDWMLPLSGAFESTIEACSLYAARHKNALRQGINLHHFSLYKHKAPIASITLSLHKGIARIDDVGTLPEFQRNGYARVLTNHALAHATRSGATYCFLESSEMGLGIYQKLGFETLFSNKVYSKNV